MNMPKAGMLVLGAYVIADKLWQPLDNTTLRARKRQRSGMCANRSWVMWFVPGKRKPRKRRFAVDFAFELESPALNWETLADIDGLENLFTSLLRVSTHNLGFLYFAGALLQNKFLYHRLKVAFIRTYERMVATKLTMHAAFNYELVVPIWRPGLFGNRFGVCILICGAGVLAETAFVRTCTPQFIGRVN